MDQEIFIAKNKYISSKRSAELYGYTHDYLSRLAKSGTIQGKKFGRAWYLEENSLKDFVSNSQIDKEIRSENKSNGFKEEYKNGVKKTAYSSKPKKLDFKLNEKSLERLNGVTKALAPVTVHAPMVINSKPFQKALTFALAGTLVFGVFFFEKTETSEVIGYKINSIAEEVIYSVGETVPDLGKQISKEKSIAYGKTKEGFLATSVGYKNFVVGVLEGNFNVLRFAVSYKNFIDKKVVVIKDSPKRIPGELAIFIKKLKEEKDVLEAGFVMGEHLIDKTIEGRGVFALFHHSLSNRLATNFYKNTDTVSSGGRVLTAGLFDTLSGVFGPGFYKTSRHVYCSVSDFLEIGNDCYNSEPIKTIVQIPEDSSKKIISTSEILEKVVIVEPRNVVETIRETIVVEGSPRVIERVITEGGITQSTFDAGLQDLRNEILAELYLGLNNVTGGGNVIQNVYQQIANSQKIDQLSNVDISGATITSSSFSGTTGTFTGGLSGATLTITGTTTFNGIGYLFPGGDGTSGQALTTNGAGGLSWTTISGGGGGGAGSFTQIAGAIYNSTTTDQVLIGAISTTTIQKLEVIGGGYFSGNLGLGTTSPYAKLSVVGEVVGRNFTSTSTTLTNTFPRLVSTYSTTTQATTTNFAITGITSTLLKTNGNGSVIPAVAGTDYVAGSSFFSFPWTAQSWGNSTSTTLGFLNGFLSTASSTINSTLRLPTLSSGGLGVDATGLVYSGATTTAGTGLTYTGNAFNVNASQTQITALGTITTGTWSADTIAVNKGGTGLTSYTLGDVLYASGTGTLAGTSTANLKSTLALNLVENTALSTWAGSTNITTLGTIGTGVWNAGAVTSSGLGTFANLLVTGSSTLQNFTALNSTTTNATTTNFAITGITSTLLKTNGNGSVIPAVAGTDYVAGSSFFAYPFPSNATSTTLTFSGGLLSTASTTLTNFTALNSTTTNATTTNFYSTTASSTNLSTSNFTIARLTGFLKATAGTVATALVDLTTDITGVLGISNGGTGTSTPSQFLFGTGSNIVSTSTIAQNYIDSAIARSTDVLTLSNWFATTSALHLTSVGGVATADIFQLPTWFATTSAAQLTTLANLSTVGTITTGTWSADTIAVNKGGTGLTSYTLGDVLYASGTGTLAGTSTSNLKSTLALNLVENTALSTWAGTSNITTLGTIATGVWQGTAVATQYGGTGQNFSASTGLIYLTSGTASATSSLSSVYIEDVYLRNDGNDVTTGQLTALNFVASSASATSTFAGGLAIETSGFVYDFSTNRVGIGTAAPTAALNIDTSTSSTTPLIIKTSGNVGNYTASTTGIFIHDVNGAEMLRIWAGDPNGNNNYWNLYIGRHAGFNQPSDNLSSSGSWNIGVGVEALYTTTSGYNNAAFGNETLYSNTSGYENAGFGHLSLFANTTGYENAGSGNRSLFNNTTGSQNSALGFHSLRYNTTGATSTAIGASSGYNPDNNIAQYRIIADTEMVLIGRGATKNNASTLTNGIAIGTNAYVLQSNQAVLGNDSITTTLLKGSVGIGTTSPYAKLSVVGEAVAAYFTATTTSVNTFPNLLSTNATTTTLGIGSLTGVLQATSGVVSATSSISGAFIEDVYLRNNADDTTTGQLTAANFVASGASATSTFAGGLAIETSGFVYDYSTNNVGIGTASPSDKLTISGGDVTITTNLPTLYLDNDGNNANDGPIIKWNSSADAYGLSFFSNTTEILRLQDNGAVYGASLGTLGGMNLGNYFVRRATTDQGISFPAGAGLSFGKGVLVSEVFTTEWMRILDNGNVGIGTTSPYAKLSVVGEAVAAYFTATTTSNNTFPNLISTYSTTTNATTTNFAISSIASGLLATNANGSVVATSTIGLNLIPDNFLRNDGNDVTTGQLTALNFVASSASATSTFAGGLAIETSGFVYDFSTNFVGIGTAAPASLLEVQGGLTTTGSVLTLGTKETTVVVNDVLGRMNFYAPLESDGTDSILVAGSIVAIAEGTFSASNNATSLLFQTGASEVATTKMIITSAGNIGIGTTSPYAKLSVAGTSVLDGTLIRFGSTTATTLRIDYASSATSTIKDNTKYAWTIATSTTATPIFRIDTTTGKKATTTIIGGLNVDSGALRYDYSSGITSIDNLDLGSLNFDTDAGIVSWVDLPVSTTTASIVQSYTAQLDSKAMLTIYGKTDGSGSVNTLGVGIGTTSPAQLTNASTTLAINGLLYIGGDVAGTSTIQHNLHVQGTLRAAVSYVGDLIFANNFRFTEGPLASSTQYLFLQNQYGSTTLAVDDQGNIGIGTSTPAYKLHVMGDIAATSFVNISTKTAKKNIEYIDDQAKNLILDKIGQVKVAKYRYIAESDNNPLRLGLIAEEAPTEILSIDGKGVDIYKLATFTLAGVQELNIKLTDIEKRVAALEAGGSSGGGISFGAFLNSLADLGLSFINGVVKIASLAVDNLTIGSPEKPTGITLYDELTGEPYCLSISGGEPVSRVGACSEMSTDDSGSSTTTTSPVITLNGNNPARIDLNSSYVDLGVTYTDDKDNNLGITASVNGGTPDVVGNISIDTSTSTEYTILYSVTDNDNNTATSTRTVIVGIPTEVTNPVVEDTSTSTPEIIVTEEETPTSTPTTTPEIIVEEETATSTPEVVIEEVIEEAETAGEGLN